MVDQPMGWESFGVVGFDLRLLLQGHTRIAKPKVFITMLLLILKICNVKPTCVVGFDLGLLLQGHTRIAKPKSAYYYVIIDPKDLQCETNLCGPTGLLCETILQEIMG